jgi:hypothetical protein
VAAPGVTIFSDVPGGGYNDGTIGGLDVGVASGASFAAPFVSGVAGLMLSVDPTLTSTQLKTIISDTAISTGNRDPDHNEVMLTDAFRAVLQAEALSKSLNGMLYSQTNESLKTDPYMVGANLGQTGQDLGSGLSGTLTDFEVYLVYPPVGPIQWIFGRSSCVGCAAQILAEPTVQSNGTPGIYDFVLATPITLDPNFFYFLNSPLTGPGPISFACAAVAAGQLPPHLGHIFGGTCGGSLGFNQTGYMYFVLNGSL